MNRFYTLPKIVQWVLALILFAMYGAVLFKILRIIAENPLWSFTLLLFVPFMQIMVTPLFKLIKLYEYLSPMLLVYAPTEKEYDLHNGTGFDYLMVMRKEKPGTAVQHKLLAYYMQGFLEIIQRVESGVLPETIKIKGSSYFFSTQTALRLGFRLGATRFAVKANLYFNFFDLLIWYSISKGKITLPNLRNIKTAEITGRELLVNKKQFERYLTYLNRRNSLKTEAIA